MQNLSTFTSILRWLSKGLYPPIFCRQTFRTIYLDLLSSTRVQYVSWKNHWSASICWMSRPENFQSWQLMLNMNSPAVAFLGISRKFLNKSDKILLLKGIIIIVSLILQTIKRWLNLLSDLREDLINQLFVPTANWKTYWKTNAQRGWVSD